MCFWSQAQLFASFHEQNLHLFNFVFEEIIKGERYFEIRKKMYRFLSFSRLKKLWLL